MTSMENGELKKYDVTVIASSDSFDLKKTIEKAGGKNVTVSHFVKVKLAYPIKKQENAFMLSAIFEMDSSETKNFESELKAENLVLRHLLLCVEKKRQGRRGKFSKETTGTPQFVEKPEKPDTEETERKNLAGSAVTNKDLEETIKQLK